MFTRECGLCECPVTSKPRRCKKKTVLSWRSCRSNEGSSVAFWKSILNCSKTQVSRVDASACQQTSANHEGAFASEGTFRKIFVVLIVGPCVDPTRYSTVGEYWKNIRGSERKCCARLVEYRIEIHRIRFPPLNNQPVSSTRGNDLVESNLGDSRHVLVHSA